MMLSEGVVEIQPLTYLRMVLSYRPIVFTMLLIFRLISIEKFVNWSKLWQLQINLNKCHVLFIRAKSDSNTFSRYTLNSSPLSSHTWCLRLL